jgi:hypothetical protein
LHQFLETIQPKLKFIPPRFNPFVLWLTKRSLPILLRVRLRPWLPAGISQIDAVNVETLVDLYQRFQAGKIRFLIALRHPEVDDPLCIAHLLFNVVPQTARKLGIQLRSPIHSHFIYDRGMTLWAGKWLGWFFSRLGGTPIHRGRRLDLTGIRSARDLFANGQFPLAIAPEGANNGHSEIVSTIKPGVAQLGFWCIEDLHTAQRNDQVWIVPISIQYRYDRPPWQRIDSLLSQLETDCGLPPIPIHNQDLGKKLNSKTVADLLYPRLLRLADRLLTEMETFYQRCYQQSFPKLDIVMNSGDRPADTNPLLIARLDRLLNIALQIAEQHFSLAATGTISDRCRRIEEAGWLDIYREDIANLNLLSPVDRGLANWTATEATLQMRHMRLVESFVAVTSNYVKEKPTAERFAETVLIMFDAIERIKGKKSPRRPRLGWRKALISIGEPISISDRWDTYSRDRHTAKQAVSDLTQDLQTALEGLITKD